MQCTSACDDCLVTFVLDGAEPSHERDQRDQRDWSGPPARHGRSVGPCTADAVAGSLVLDEVEVVAVRRLVRAGLVPALRHEQEAVAVP